MLDEQGKGIVGGIEGKLSLAQIKQVIREHDEMDAQAEVMRERIAALRDMSIRPAVLRIGPANLPAKIAMLLSTAERQALAVAMEAQLTETTARRDTLRAGLETGTLTWDQVVPPPVVEEPVEES